MPKVKVTVRRILFVEATVTKAQQRKLKALLADEDMLGDVRDPEELVQLLQEADPEAWKAAEADEPIYEVRESR